jgi:hypothetical protein
MVSLPGNFIHTNAAKQRWKCKSPADAVIQWNLWALMFSAFQKYRLKLLNKLDNKFYYVGLYLPIWKRLLLKKQQYWNKFRKYQCWDPHYLTIFIENIIKRLKIKYAQGTLIAKNSNNDGILDLIEIMRTSSAIVITAMFDPNQAISQTRVYVL